MLNLPISKISDIPIYHFSSIEQAANCIINNDNQVMFGNAIAINPEKIMAAFYEPELKLILQRSSINYADGIGVVKLLQKRNKTNLVRIPGCELWEVLMQRAGKNCIPVFLVGATEDVLEQTASKLSNEMMICIVGKQHGYFNDEKKVIENIINSKAKIVSVAMGSPKQEWFIEKCKSLHPECFYMGVGGTYNVYTGAVTRAPKFFRKLNIEWLYRFLLEPKRIFRNTSLIKYIYLSLINKI